MSRSDYAHWNEDADYMWWHEEGKHVEEPPSYDDDPNYGYYDEPEQHSSLDECLETGDFSSKDSVLWRCDHCEDEYVFVQDEDRVMRSLAEVAADDLLVMVCDGDLALRARDLRPLVQREIEDRGLLL